MRMRPRMLVICLFIVGAGAAIVWAQSSMADFGMKETEIKSRLVNSLTYGHVSPWPDRKLFKAAAPSVQATFVKNTLSWVKAYTETDAFKADYAKQREAAKPTPPKAKGSADDQYAKQMADQRKSIEDMKKNIAKMPPEMQKQMQATVKDLEANMANSSKDPQMAAMMKQNIEMSSAQEQKDYQGRVEGWEKKFPADSKKLIAARLGQFLEVSKDVNFDAKLVSNGYGKMKFADPRLEAKSYEWKLCYRAGKEPVQAARAFAQEWLGQLEKK
jgi:hypothetical protein